MKISIAIALTWEFGRRVWREAALGVVATAIAFPLVLHQFLRLAFSARGFGAFPSVSDFVESSGWTSADFHVAASGLLMINAIAPVLAVRTLRTGHFCAPTPTWLLAACRMLPGMVLVAAMYLVIAASYRLLFGLTWPFWGPALFFAVATACGHATLWSLPDFRAWKLAAGLLLWASLLVWGITRYTAGGLGWPTRMWEVLTFTDALMLSLHATVAYALGVVSLASLRSNDCRRWPDPRAWLRGIVECVPSRRQSFRSPVAAQIWLEWREKGLDLSLVAATIMILIVLGWALFEREADSALGAAQLLLFVWVFAPLVFGLFLGSLGSPRSKSGVEGFRAVRPLTDAGIASSVLRSGFFSILVVGVVCVVGLGVTLGWLYANGETEIALYRSSPGLLEAAQRLGIGFPPIVLGACLLTGWTLMALSASVMLVGRIWLSMSIYAALIGFAFISMLSPMMIPEDAHLLVLSAVAWVVGVACLSGTIWLFFTARQRRLVEPSVPWIGFGFWCALAAVCAPLAISSAPGPAAIVFYLGLLAMPVCPLAAAPLAVAWNRHR